MTNKKENKEWFAIYVRSRSEKKVLKLLENEGIESFLPLITRIKQWSDRKKKVEEPLFRSYLFVHVAENHLETIKSFFGVARVIKFEDKAVSIPDNQILAIRQYISDTDLHDIDYADIKEGELVIIKSGQMKGLIGRFVEIRGKHRLIVDIDVVGKTIPINIARSKVDAFRDKK